MPAMNNDGATASAERLKSEGNVLHTKRNYKAAYEKYSQAIQEDPKNAILWCNRAASCITMKRYMDAVGDARKATTLDPGYCKAWGRLATARHKSNSWSEGIISAWTTALKCLPSNRELTAAEQSLKADAEEGLRKAQVAANEPSNVTPVPIHTMPWVKALAMKDELNASGHPSSAHALLDASFHWNRGIAILDQQQIRTVQNGDKILTGPCGAMDAFSNAIMCDSRIFHIPSRVFVSKYNQQILMEVRTRDAWESEGPKAIQVQAKQRLEQSGWDKLRPALSVTIQAWIIRAHMLLEDRGVAGEPIAMAIEMLEWGRKLWKDVPREQRGTIFDDTFLLGVRRLQITALLQSIGSVGLEDTVPEEKLQEIQDIANTILHETSESKHSSAYQEPDGQIKFGFWASFWLYPRGEAHAALGWCKMRFGNRRSLSLQERLQHYADAADLYHAAANCFLKDDEKHLIYRMAAVEALWFSQAPLAITLPYIEDTKLLIPDAGKIWGGLNTFRQLVDQVSIAEAFADQFQEAVDRGDVTLEDSLCPDFVTKCLAQSK